jgi:exopolysaccharide biosynthesis polyprenyl glycosylphosphotransferase
MDRRALFPRVMMAVDAVVVAAAFVLSYYLRKLLPKSLGLLGLGPIDHYLWILLATIPLWWLLLFLGGAYRPKVESAAAIVRLALKVGAAGLLALALLLFLIKFETFNRSLLVLFVVVETAMLIVTRIALSSWLALRRRAGKSTRHALIVAADGPDSRRQTSLLLDGMRRNPEEGVVPVGFLTLGNAAQAAPAGLPSRGTVEELPDLLHQEVVDEVYFVLPPSMLDHISDYLKLCEEMGVEGKVLAQLYRPALARPYLEESFDLPFFSFSPTPLSVGRRYVKEVIDVAGALALLTLLALPMALIGVLIRLGSGGPVLFRQERGGRHGRRFTMYKFRTMIPEADRIQGELADRNQMSGPVFKIANDPRVTLWGGWLRRASLDELPQLINVLKGDMSLVGPRPLPLAQAAQIKGPLRRRFSMKPGITGLWQSGGRSGVDFADWMKLDLEYVDNWSLRLDCRIVFRTVLAVLSGKGAH